MTPKNSMPGLLGRKRTFHKYISLPTCLLMLNIVEEVFCYKSQLVEDPYLRTGAIVLMFICGFGLVGFVMVPVVTVFLEEVYFSGRKRGGLTAEIVVLLVLYVVFFYIYFQLYSRPGGVENLLPQSWHNHPEPL